MCQVHIGAYVSLLVRLEKSTIPLATQERLSRIYCTQYLSLRIRTTDANQLEGKQKIKERKEKTRKRRNEKGKKKKEKTRHSRKGKIRRGSKG